MAMEQSATPQMSLSPSSSSASLPIEIGLGSGIMQLPDEVLQHMLRFVTFADVKAARLVNKHWRQVTTTPLRRSSKEIKLDQWVFECVTKMGDGQFPGYRFEVQLYDDPEKAKVCYPFFSGICAWVKELTLRMDMDIDEKSRIRMDMGTFPKDCIYQDLTHFNLRHYEKTPCNPEFWKEFTDFAQNVLKKSPNLREVNVQYLNCKHHKLPICTVIEDLFPNSNSAGISKLKYIDFHGVPLEKIDLAKWSTLNFKLRKLEIALSSFSSNLNALLAKFLESQSGTLKELTFNLNGYDSIRSSIFTFPRMEKLEQLGFTRFPSMYVTSTLVTFPRIDYVRLFPCLKKVDLKDNGYCIDWNDFFGNHLLEPTNTVEELIFRRDLRSSATVISAAARIFPSLRKLEIPGFRVYTEAVYENMPSLEVLSFIGQDLPFDCLITGLGLEICFGLRFEVVMTESLIQKLKTAEGRSMARLQKLKILKLSNNGYNPICFSRLSFHVFQQMSSLQCLDLNGRVLNEDNVDHEQQRQFLADLQEKFVVL